MKYYHYRPDADHFAGVGLSQEDRHVITLRNSDRPLRHDWQRLVVHGFADNPDAQGDFPSLSDFNEIPIMSERAWKVLESLIANACEPLPIVHPSGQPFFIIHVMETVDALDRALSSVWRNPVTGRIGDISRYCLRRELLQGKHIFKLPNDAGGELIVDHTFREAVEANCLEGLLFPELPMANEHPLANC